MPSWKGNPKADAPNPLQEGPNLSNKKRQNIKLSSFEDGGENRAVQTRRDNDKMKNVSIKLMDIDTIIFNHMVELQLRVVDEGEQINVPIYYASPEKWKSVQKDGVFRDYNGKIVLPAIVFHREMSEKDTALTTFNRYLRYPVMKKYSTKNKYTPFSVLLGQNVPVNEVYDVVYPDHMIFTYKFVVWTEYVEQMNTLIEKISFETEDYWGAPRGIRLRTKVDSYSHTVELSADTDRVVKTDFNLIVNGYLLPDAMNLEFEKLPTVRKVLTPKKILMGMEVVTSDFDPTVAVDPKTIANWRSKKYPNLQRDDEPPAPPIVWSDTVADSSTKESVVATFNSIYRAAIRQSSGGSTNVWATVPSGPGSPGSEGQISVDSEYFYVYSSGQWRRVAISQFI